MPFKLFHICSSGNPPVQWSKTINVILKEGIMGNHYVKLYEIWTSGSGEKVYERTHNGRTDPRWVKTDRNSSP